MVFDPVLLSRLQFAFVIIRTGTPVRGLPTRSTSWEVRKMASPFKRVAGRALRPRPRFRGPSPAAVALRCGAVLAALPLGGCQELIVLHPKGVVGEATSSLLIGSFIIMLPIVVPTMLASLVFGWWYRRSNTRAYFDPSFVESGKIEIVTWSLPLLTIMLLGSVAWISSHDLDPAKPLSSDEEPLNVQAVSLDWKWLFIYPDQNVASVNRLVIPAGVPIHFRLT